jgi:hypothetical protein
LEISKYEKTDLILSLKNENIDKIIKHEVENLKTFAYKKNITIINNSKFNFFIDLDSFHIKRVLNNLIYNAIKHCFNNGKIIITAEKTTDYELKIYVSDNGQGLNKDIINNLFENYFQDNCTNHGSYGIGLAYCKIAVEAHKGKIGAFNNNGATFWFTINSKNKIVSDNASHNTLVKPNLNFDLNIKDKELLSTYINKLKNIEIDEITTYKNILKTIPDRSNNIILWKNEVYNSVISANVDKLKLLLDVS